MVAEEKSLDQAEELLGDHLTGGVVQGWRLVQRNLCILVQGEARRQEFGCEWCWPCSHRLGVGGTGSEGASTDHDKLLARLEAELRESQQLVRLQQQFLQVLYPGQEFGKSFVWWA